MFGRDEKPKTPEANEQLLKAFEMTYNLAATEEEADEVFDYAKLRQYFGAMQIPKMPDPLPPYLDKLDDMGYQFKMSYSGDPAIFVTRRGKRRLHSCPELGWEDETSPEGEMLTSPEGEGCPTPSLPLVGGGFFDDEDEEDDDEDE